MIYKKMCINLWWRIIISNYIVKYSKVTMICQMYITFFKSLWLQLVCEREREREREIERKEGHSMIVHYTGEHILKFKFCVKFYVTEPGKLSEEYTR